MSLLLGEDESTEILTPKLMRVRMKLLRSEIKELIVNLEEMTVDEFNKYIGIGPPGNYPELYEAGQASLVSHLKSIHIGLTARGTSNRLDQIGAAAIELGVTRGVGRIARRIGISDSFKNAPLNAPEHTPRSSLARQPSIKCADVSVCSFNWN